MAIDAQKGGKKCIIEVESEIEDNNIKVSVTDQGSGVSSEVAEKLFKEMITSKGAQGTGIGLYMSNVVIRGKFSGTMWYEKNQDKGSTFGFTIPYLSINNDEFIEEKKYEN